MIIQNFEPFHGENCETTTACNLLKQNGVELSEPMLFGIGEGLGFIYWDSKQMGYPFLGGRSKQDVLTEKIVKNLNLELNIKETSSQKKAWEYVKTNIDNGRLVGLKLDSYYLEYFTNKIHFAAHYVTMYGYDETYGYLIDTVQQGAETKSSLASIAEARNAKGPMSSRNRAFTITKTQELPDLKNVILKAVMNNTHVYLHPPIENLYYKGIRKAGRLIAHWLDKPDLLPEKIVLAGTLMENGGTGGALFRNMYRDFLQECTIMYPELGFHEAYLHFKKIAPMWTEVSKLIVSAGETLDKSQLSAASELLMDIADNEEHAMRELSKHVADFGLSQMADC